MLTASAPTTFARTQGQFSRTARDYVYLGPVEIAEAGSTEYFWWVGIASTIDRNFVAAEDFYPDLLVLEIENLPVEFSLEPWEERTANLADSGVYEPAVSPTQVLGARATRDQIARFATNPPDRVRIGTADGATVEYPLWGQASDWSVFAGRGTVR